MSIEAERAEEKEWAEEGERELEVLASLERVVLSALSIILHATLEDG